MLETPTVQKPSASALRNLHHHIVLHVQALRTMNQPIDTWDAWLVTLVCSRLVPTTVGEWQLIQISRELSKFSDLEKFLASRVSAYEVGDIGKQREDSNKQVAKRVLLASPAPKSYSKEKCVLYSGTQVIFL